MKITSAVDIEMAPDSYSRGVQFESRPGHLLSWQLSWFFSVPAGKCVDNTSFRPWLLPFKSSPIHSSFIIPPFDTIQLSYWRHSRGRSVGIVVGYGLDGRGVGRVKNFFFFTSSRPALGLTQPPTQGMPRAPFLGVKRPGREADHSPPTSADVKNMWIYTTAAPYAFMA
jgi:hypothetical protein